MKKVYISGSDVAFSVIFADGSRKHIKFSPRTGGGSVYYSSDEAEQRAIESHSRFGRLFRLDATRSEQEQTKAATVQAQAQQEQPTGSILTEIIVSDIEEAKNYLCERFGLSRTKLRYKSNIVEAAKKNGIKFIGLEKE